MLRSLTHYWRVNLALLAAVVVTSAVMTGALIVGDSVRESLSDLVLDRLGEVDSALLTERFVDESLALRVSGTPSFQEHSISATPVIFLPGSVRHPGTERRASMVRIYGVDGRFEKLFDARLDLERDEGQIFPSAVINSSLARDIGARVGRLGRRDRGALSLGLYTRGRRVTPAEVGVRRSRARCRPEEPRAGVTTTASGTITIRPEYDTMITSEGRFFESTTGWTGRHEPGRDS